MCISCFSLAYKYDDICYVSCDALNKPSENKFFVNDVENMMCHECTDFNCMNCSNNYKVCDACINGFHLDNDKFIHDLTKEFIKSIVFT